ncbi:hypothetical protein [Methylobacterium sp. WCS2018Hpa-22]|uniref:hypothetical protein n=1 Tax=Methylobacterium sp. WCS2018Hpa-22 TaxID=3073633 RepID=UPI00288AAF47|nr:hypothetical protein [Methylobacterium sp. WCS2018Hpa-22]
MAMTMTKPNSGFYSPDQDFYDGLRETRRDTDRQYPDFGQPVLPKIAKELWDSSLRVLDRQRALPTVQEQVAAMTVSVKQTPYVLAVVPSEQRLSFVWVKGLDAYSQSCNWREILSQAGVFNMPTRKWAELLLIAYGGRLERQDLRKDAIRRMGRGAVRQARKMVTLIGTEMHHGPQPDRFKSLREQLGLS